MSKISNKLFADYESKHIIMTFPSMHNKEYYYDELVSIYIKLCNIFSMNNIKQTIVVNNKDSHYKKFLNSINAKINVLIYNCNDIWIRDYYPKIYIHNHDKRTINFDYNAYGEKYRYVEDNDFKDFYKIYASELDLKNIIFEGGNLEFSSKGVLITNKNSFIKNNINLKEDDIFLALNDLKKKIDIPELYILNSYPLLGDDTNGHIDNLVRFISDDTLLYFASLDKTYCNYDIAYELEQQIRIIHKKSKVIKNIIPIYHSENDTFIKNNNIYPYSKLNFIATKNCFIFPTIKNNESTINNDLKILPIKKNLYTINCEASLLENGGPHCLTVNI